MVKSNVSCISYSWAILWATGGIGRFVDSRMRRTIVDDGMGSQSAIRQRNIRLNVLKTVEYKSELDKKFKICISLCKYK